MPCWLVTTTIRLNSVLKIASASGTPSIISSSPGPGGGIDSVWPDDEAGGLVQVGTGLYTERLPVGGMTIDEIRET